MNWLATEQLTERTKNGEILPLLHIEAHGSDYGLTLASLEVVPWETIKTMTIDLNIASKLNLFFVLACCEGASFLKSFSLLERAPFWGFIGTTTLLKAKQAKHHFGAFYSAMFKTLTPADALEALVANAPPSLYLCSTAERLFYAVWREYRKTHCTRKELDKRARRMRRTEKEKGTYPLVSVGRMKRILIRHEPESFDKFRDCFFMCDIYPEHSSRFSVSYQRAQKAA